MVEASEALHHLYSDRALEHVNVVIARGLLHFTRGRVALALRERRRVHGERVDTILGVVLALVNSLLC